MVSTTRDGDCHDHHENSHQAIRRAAAGIAALLTIVNLAPAGEPRPRYRTAPTIDETRIEVDQAANAIRFYIRGEQVALIDSQGLSG